MKNLLPFLIAGVVVYFIFFAGTSGRLNPGPLPLGFDPNNPRHRAILEASRQ